MRRAGWSLIAPLVFACSDDPSTNSPLDASVADASVADASVADATTTLDAGTLDTGVLDATPQTLDATPLDGGSPVDADTPQDASPTPDAQILPDAEPLDTGASGADTGVDGGAVNRNYAQWPMPDSRSTLCSSGTMSPIPCPALGQAAYGQDGNYTVHAPAYNTTVDTVEDLVTGLIWQRVSVGANLDWARAVTFCEDLVLAGQSDWRLPSAIELMSLADMGDTNGRLDATTFPGLSNVYWSSTQYAWYEPNKWSVSLGTGFRDFTSISMTLGAMCVRGGGTHAGPRYTITNDVVTDNATGLIWQRGVAPNTLSWINALAYCQDLNLGGFSDWRLPSLKELHTSFDDEVTMPGIDANAFPNTPATITDYFWSATPHYTYDEVVWAVKYQFGTTEAYYTTGQFSDTGHARCVR